MEQAKRKAEKVALSDVLVVLKGETGTGKELFARLIHNLSNRWRGPFIAANCGAIPDALIDSLLFGREKGAFTGSDARVAGWFELATKGTLFLDEFTDLSLDLQSRLLRVLDGNGFYRVGGTALIKPDFRLICASHGDLDNAFFDGALRRDLYYRVKGVTLDVPPLRERRGDIPELAVHFLRQFTGGRVTDFTDASIETLLMHDWPGNVRELKRTVENAAALCDGESITEHDIRDAIGVRTFDTTSSKPYVELQPLGGILKLNQAMNIHISRVFEMCGRNAAATARTLGISRSTLFKRLKQLGQPFEASTFESFR
jgi:DNA-binding NtrC family response regulator